VRRFLATSYAHSGRPEKKLLLVLSVDEEHVSKGGSEPLTRLSRPRPAQPSR